VSDQQNYMHSSDFIQRLGPEGLQKLMEMGALDEQGNLLTGQLQQAQALRQPGPERYGAAGAGLQALADSLNTFRGYRDENTVRGQMQDVIGKKTQARNAVAAAYANSQPFSFGQPQQTQPANAGPDWSKG
jgi:hypothetical protein